MKKNLRLLVSIALLCYFGNTSLIAQVAPANDSCTNAIPVLFEEIVNFSTIGATSQGPSHPDDCVSSGVAPDSTGADIWYTFTAPSSASVRWTLCGTADFDTKIIVYAPGSNCLPADTDLLACSEDANDDNGDPCANATSAVAFDMVEGETYLLRLGGWVSEDSASAGSGTFIIEAFTPPVGPPNNDCANAIPVALGPDQEVTNNFATTDGPIHPDDNICFGFNDNTAQADVWYTFTSTITGTVEWSTCGTVNWDSRLVVYGPNVDCETASPDNMIGCSDATSGCPGFTNIVFFDVQQDSTYLLRVGGFGGATGVGTFSLLETNPPEPPGNDLCGQPDSVYLISQEEADDFETVFDGSTIAATGTPGVVDPLCGTGQGGDFPDVWYAFNSQGNTEIEVRFATLTEGAEFYCELYETCNGQIDIAVDTFCFLYDNLETGLLVDTITNLPTGTAKDYLLRVSSWIFEPPGDFFFQLVADTVMLVNTEELFFPGETMLFPNPAQDRINLQLHLDRSADVDILVYNALGQQVELKTVGNLNRGDHLIDFNTTAWPQGIYFMQIQASGAARTLRLLKS